MPLFNFVRWLKSLSRSRVKTIYRKPRLHLETLEDRLAPAQYVWSGLGADNKWTTGANWVGGVAPTATAASMDDLVFGPGASQLTTRNDFIGGVFNSITFSDNNYTLLGTQQLTLGDPTSSGSGYIVVNSNVTGNIISLNVKMGGAAGSQQFFTINNGADLLISGKLTGATGSNITKDGGGLLYLSNDNSGFIGDINVSVGYLQITHAKALGDSVGKTFVATGAQLQVNNSSGSITGNINEVVRLRDTGFVGDGAILNVGGTSTWSGNVEMDSDVTFGSAAGNLIISGVISDLGPASGFNVTKEGAGQISFDAANTYRGTTLIQNGILEIRDAQALGTTDGSAATGTTINQSIGKIGTLQINNAGTVVNERLVIASPGGGNGSIYNIAGDNEWTGNVILNTNNNNFGVNQGTSLLVGQVTGETGTGIVSGSGALLRKIGLGNLIFTSANIYTGGTGIIAGTLTIRDSRGLGSIFSGTTVALGATLALEVDQINDSVTGDAIHLSVAEPLTISSTGTNNNGGLENVSGYNTYTASISLTGTEAAIGVQPDTRIGHTRATNAYFNNDATGDYHLTVTGTISGNTGTTFSKVGTGHLILPNANTYVGPTKIKEGWVTIQNNESLGPQLANTPPTKQPITSVSGGAALHLKPLTPGQNLNIKNNLNLIGMGIDHNFDLIDEKGAVVSLGGKNILSGNIGLEGQVGIGVQQVDPSQDPTNPSELTATGTIFEVVPPVINASFTANGGSAEERFPIDTGAVSGTIIVDYDFFSVPDRLTIYYDADGNASTGVNGAELLLFDTGVISGGNVVTIPYGPGLGTIVELVMNEGGGNSGTAWVLNQVTIIPNAGAGVGGITKLGQRRLNLQGDGTYRGDVIVAEGVLRAQHDTALGTAANGATTSTTVEAGAALELAAGLAPNNGGIAAGIQVWNEQLILNGSGNSFFGDAPLVNMNGLDLAGNPMAGDSAWRGQVSLNTFGTTYDVTFQGALGGTNHPPMTVDDTNLTGTNAAAAVTTTANGGPGNEVQTITFSGDITGGTFTLSFGLQSTGPIAYSSNASTLAHNIQTALDKLVTVGIGNSVVANNNATIDVRKGTRLNIFGAIDDAANADVNGSDVNIISSTGGSPYPGISGTGGTGPSELALQGVNTYRGTTYVNPDVVLVLESSQGLGATGTGSVQTVTLGGLTTGTFKLSFNGAITGALAYAATAAQVQTALNNLITIGGATVGGSVSVSRSGDVFTITFGGNLKSFHQALLVATGQLGTTASVAETSDGAGGTIVASGASIELQGNITVPEAVIIQGQGVATTPNIPFRWFQQGPAGIVDSGQTSGQLTATGRITGIAIDPRDANVIYVSTAGGGAWKTINGGKTWRPLFDAAAANPIPMFAGAIAISQSNPNVIYLGTGEANNSFDSYYGTGVYKSTDAGVTWTRVLGPVGPNSNPLDGRAVSKIVVDPVSPDVIYVAASDLAQGSLSGNAGIWRYNGTSWTNLSAAAGAAADNADVEMNTSDASWSDVAIMTDPVNSNNRFIAIAQGTPSGGPSNINGIYGNAVFLSLTNGSSWTVNAFPTTETVNNINYPYAGVIKLAMSRTPNAANQPVTTTVTNVYAVITYPTAGFNLGLANQLRDIQETEITWDTNNGIWVIDDWDAATLPANYLSNMGSFATSVAGSPTSAAEVYIGGTGTAAGTNIVLRSTDSGGGWTDITLAGSRGPHAGVHAMALDPNGKLVIGTDGGIYQWDNSGASALWNDLNGNLAITQFNGISVDPTNPNAAFGGARSNGTSEFGGNFVWDFSDNTAASAYTMSGGRVWIDPNNTQNIYAIQNDGTPNTVLRRSQDGGNTWTTVATLGSGVPGTYMSTPPLVMDSVNSNRLLSWGPFGTGLTQYLVSGSSVSTVGLNFSGVTHVAAAAYQGQWVDDVSFSAAQGDVDLGANTYVPNTIWAVSGNTVFLTKNGGTLWINRDFGPTVVTPLPTFMEISDIIVDPRNRDTAYVVSSASQYNNPDLGRVFMTTDAGINWTDITGSGSSGLPDVPTWKIVLDPRDGTLYVGNDYGVYRSDGGGTWTRMGAGLPFVQVKDLVLNQSQNTLSAGTYGRSMYTFWLNQTQANAGVLSSVSGSAVWTGNIILAADTVISAKGTQQLQNGVAAATLNIVGVISDQTANGNHKLDKIGFGNVILSGANTYGGVTEIKEGVLVARNNQALGAPTAKTIVNLGTSLNLESSISGEPLFLNGDGVKINGHYTGALRNTANNNTYTGPIILQAADPGRDFDPGVGGSIDPLLGTSAMPVGTVTVGVNLGTSLTIANSISDLGQALTLTKELTGTLILAQGVTFDVTFQGPKGNSAQPTMQANGAGLTGTRPTVSVNTILPGSATNDAIQTISFGGNVTGGTFTLTFDGETTAPITWQQDANALLADIQSALENLPTKLDPGDIALAANMWRGGTVINQGIVQLRNGMGLGSELGAVTSVRDGSQLQFMGTVEVQTITVTGVNGTFNVEFNGQTVTGLAYNASAATLETALNNLPTISGVGGSVTVTKSGQTYTITFGGSFTGLDVPQLDATRVGGIVGSTATEATLVHGSGPIVVPNSQVLYLSGTGLSNTGALLATNGSHVWSGNVFLQKLGAFSPSSSPSGIVALGATLAGDTLTIGGTIEEDPESFSAPPYGLNKVGAGKVILQGNNTYSGTTTVSTGTLAIQHVHALGNNTAGTTVNNGARLQLDIAAGGTVAGEALTLNGSGISNSGALQNLAGANTWSGGVSLATSSTIGVVGGSLNVTGLISGSASNTLTKRGANTLTVSNAGNTFGGTTSIVQGALVVNGTLGAITLSGGILGGTGTVGAVTSAVAGGFIAPGASPETLNTGALTLNSATTLVFELNGTTPGNGVTGYDQIIAAGTVALGSANLGGAVGFSPTVGDSFVIIQATGNISGTFAQGGDDATVFISGFKFTIDIDNSGATKKVTLIHAASATTTTVTSSQNPSVYGEDVTFTAAVTSEQGGPASGTVDFIVDGTTVANDVALAGGIATYSSDSLSVSGSPHTVTVNFTSGSGSFGPSSGSLTGGQTVNKANTGIVVTSSTGGTSVYGQDVTFTATVNPVAPGAGVPTGNVTFKIDGNTVVPSFTLSGGTFALVVSNLAVSGTAHTVSVSYSGDSNFNTSTGSLAGGQTVGKGNTSVAVSSSTGGTSVFGQAVTFTATVSALSPAVGTPTGNVRFIIDGVTQSPVGGVAINGSGEATFSTSNLAVGVHTVTVNYLGNANFNTGTGSLAGDQTVNKASTTTTVSSSTGGTSVFGQTVTFTATVAAVSPGTGTPAGNIQFVIDGATQAATALSSGQATYTTSTLAVSLTAHTVTVNYLGNSSYDISSGTLGTGQTVNKGSTSVAVSSSNNPSVFGQSVTFTATVGAISPASGTPTGNVEFVIDGSTVTPVGGIALNGSGQATYSTSSLAVSGPVHSVIVNYLGSTNFNTNSGSLAGGQTVNKASTSTSIGSNTGTTVFGQTVTFTATVSAVSPGVGTPTGNVDFLVDGTSVGFGTLNGLGVALFPTNAISVAGSPHTVSWHYVGDTNFSASDSANGSHTVNKANTSMTMSSSAGTTVYGQAVTFTATVSPVGPGQGTPGGNVDFLVDGVSVGSGSLSGGIAEFSTTTISVTGSPHAITANYLGNGSFNTTSGSVTGGHTVTVASTSNTISTSDDNAGYGEPTITASVSVTSPGGGTPTGNVDFVVDDLVGTNDFTQTKALVGNIATFDVLALTPGTYSITAQYQGDGSNYNAAAVSSAISQIIVKANTTTTVSSSTGSTSVFGQNVTFTATVASATGGLGTPTGFVEFLIDGATVAASVALSGGTATFQTSTLSVSGSPHSVVANYLTPGDTNFNPNTGTATSHTVNPASTTTSVTRTQSSPTAYGTTVTFTASVSAQSPGAGTVTGSVEFVIDGATQAPTALSGGVATFETAALTPAGSPHSISVNYIESSSADFNASSGTLAGGHSVSKIASTVTVSSSSSPTPNTSVFGEPVTFTATVAANASPDLGTPTGTVNFLINGVTVASGVGLSGGTAESGPISNLAASGTAYVVTVEYTGSSNYNGNTGTTNQTVNQADTTTTLNTTIASGVYGQEIITATVAAVSPGGGIPAGTVTFHIDDGVNPVVDITENVIAGIATLGTKLDVGSYMITATFNDASSPNHLGSNASAISQAVSKANTTAAVSSSTGGNSVFGQMVTFTATVTTNLPGTGTPTGNVEFVIDGATMTPGGVALNGSGKATFQIFSLSVGPHTVSVNYLGSGNHNTSTASLAGGQTVTQAGSTVTVTSSVNPSVIGQAVTFTAYVAALLPGGGVPTGTVNFIIDGTTVPTGVVLVGGQATFTTSALAVGTHTVQANFISSDGNHANNSGGLTAGVHTVLGFSKIGVAVNKKTIGVNVPFAMTLTAQASNGATVTNYNGNARIVLQSAPAGGSIIGLKSARFVNGKLTLRGLRLTRPGVYKIKIVTGGKVTIVTIRSGGTWTYAQKQ